LSKIGQRCVLMDYEEDDRKRFLKINKIITFEVVMENFGWDVC